jgi:hypothetical protein
MTVITDIGERVTRAVREQASRYAQGSDRPLRGYAAAMGIYGGAVASVAAGVKLTGRNLPDGLAAGDVVLCAVATHKLSRLLAKDPVTSPLRVPFAAYRGTEGPAELDEEVRGRGAQKAVGELVTCPFCIGMWVATGLTAGLVFAPRVTRVAMGTLTALAGADILQFAHAWLEKAAD